MSRLVARRIVCLLDNYAYDVGGEIVFDRCPTEADHMIAPLAKGREYRDCRVYLRDLLPGGCLRKKGTFMIEMRFVSDEEIETEPKIEGKKYLTSPDVSS
jgi:hypothetical protein